MIKKIILGLVLFTASNAMMAQNFGVRAGVNISNINGDSFPNSENLTGYYVGITREMPIVKSLLYVQPEVQYSSQGFEIPATAQEVKIDYITVPVLAKVYVAKLFSFETGPQFGFKISDKVDGPANPDFESFDPSWAFGMSLNLPLGLSINGRYVSSLNDAMTDLDGKNQVFQIGAGFHF